MIFWTYSLHIGTNYIKKEVCYNALISCEEEKRNEGEGERRERNIKKYEHYATVNCKK
jgi:hypothetical protein